VDEISSDQDVMAMRDPKAKVVQEAG
jgi:hypothetical protein